MRQIGILITARLGSTRLKRKHLLDIEGRPAMGILLARIRREFTGELAGGTAKIIIATADEPENREFTRFTDQTTTVFYGSVRNLPLRHLETAREHGLDAIVAVDGDDILCSRQAMRAVFAALADNGSYVKTAGLPIGLNAFGYSTEFLAKSLQAHSEEVLETGWGRIFSDEHLLAIPMPLQVDVSPEILDRLRYTLDYPVDYDLFRNLVMKLGGKIDDASDGEIVAATVANGLYKLNQAVVEEYWDNVSRNIALEENKS